MYEFKPDYEISKRRIDAFWQREIIDRPVVQFGLEKAPEERVPLPGSLHAAPAQRWLDAQYQAELSLAALSNQLFLGDSMPVAWPNLGPDVFAALYGCPLYFGDYGTSWSEPALQDWGQAQELKLDWNSFYLGKLHEMTDALLDVGRGKFITGMSDWHAGGDCLAALRGPIHLATDLISQREDVAALLEHIEADYLVLYDLFYQRLRSAGQPIATWVPLVSEGKFYIVSNDFSIMISTKMFEEIFLPGLVRECRFLDHSIYHLDGPGAVRHLDCILAIPELDCLQFVPTTGDAAFSKWAWVYQRVQAAGKCVQVNCDFSEVEQVMQALQPEGLFLNLSGVPSAGAAKAMLHTLERWCVNI